MYSYIYTPSLYSLQTKHLYSTEPKTLQVQYTHIQYTYDIRIDTICIYMIYIYGLSILYTCDIHTVYILHTKYTVCMI